MKKINYSKGFEQYPENQEELDMVTGSIAISTTISQELWRLAKKHRIAWSEGLRVGLSIILADLGVKEYDNNLNIYRKMRFFQKKVEEYGTRIAEMEEKQEKLKGDIKDETERTI